MNIETLQAKLENQQKLIKELTSENEELYHQYNHLMVRNGKMLKRIDDLQKIIDDLHLRIEELQLINGNMLQINDRLRRRNESKFTFDEISSEDGKKFSLLDSTHDLDLESLYERWKNYPEQVAQNSPNLRKQVLMMAALYTSGPLRASELFNKCGIGGVTGARYIAALKKFGMVAYKGARKKGQYEIISKGIELIENTFIPPTGKKAELADNPIFEKIRSERKVFTSAGDDDL